MDFYSNLQEKLKNIIEENNLDNEDIMISTKTLTPEEAIGITKRKDFPLLDGKEVLMEARFKDSIGQAYTDSPSVYKGNIDEILELDLDDNRNKVLFIASLNAVLKHLELIEETIHCKNEEPEDCAEEIVKFIGDKFDDVKIGMVGFQPAMIENLEKDFDLRVLDLDPNNIGERKYNILIEDGNKDREEVLDWADILLVTGSTVTNGSIVNYIRDSKPVFFYGTTVAGTAYLEGLDRLCFCAK